METEMEEFTYNYTKMNREQPSISESTDSSLSNEINQKSESFPDFKNWRQALKIGFLLVLMAWNCLICVSLFRTSYVRERNLCPYSELWSYLLVSLITELLLLVFVYKDIILFKLDSFPYLPLYYLRRLALIDLGLSIWGSLLFFSFSCSDKLKNTFLFWIALYQYLFNVVSASLLGLISLKKYVDEGTEEITEEQIESLAEQLGRSNSDSSQSQVSDSFSLSI